MLGLSRQDRRRAKVLGCPDPGEALVKRRVAVLREHRWSSWPAYAGSEANPDWMSTDRIQGGYGGRTLKAQRTALVQSTEEPIRQGRLDDPWERVVGGAILGDAAEAVATRHLGWRLMEVVRQMPGVKYAAAAQGIRRLEAGRERSGVRLLRPPPAERMSILYV